MGGFSAAGPTSCEPGGRHVVRADKVIIFVYHRTRSNNVQPRRIVSACRRTNDMRSYPARIGPDGGGFRVSFPDIPEALTGAATREEALALTADALTTAMDFYFEDRRPVPAPSAPKRGQI